GGLASGGLIWWLNLGLHFSLVYRPLPWWLHPWLPASIGAVVGYVVACAIREGKSGLPGVNRLIAELEAAGYPAGPKPAQRPFGSGDLTPAAGPEGRGDEPAATP